MLGLRANAAQFTLLVVVNALVGGMVGQQQAVLPLLAENEFGLSGYTFIFTYVTAFGITKPPRTTLPGPSPTATDANPCCWWDGCSPCRYLSC